MVSIVIMEVKKYLIGGIFGLLVGPTIPAVIYDRKIDESIDTQKRVMFNHDIYQQLERAAEKVVIYSLLESGQADDAQRILYEELTDALNSLQLLNKTPRSSKPFLYQNIKKGLVQAIESLEQHLGIKEDNNQNNKDNKVKSK